MSTNVQFNYLASLEPYEAQGRRFVKVFVIEPGVIVPGSPNPWGVTREALNNALTTLIGKPLVGLGHDATQPFGRFIGYESNRAVYGIAEITSDEAWTRIKSGQWRYVSPQVQGTIVRQQNGADVIEAFQFSHVAFVDQPAFGPEAQVKGTCEGVDSPVQCSFAASLSRSLSELRSAKNLSDEKSGQTRLPFEQCVRDRISDGYGEDSARRICAAIKNRTVNRGIQTGWWKDTAEGIKAIARKINEDPVYAYTLDRLYALPHEIQEFLGSQSQTVNDVTGQGDTPTGAHAAQSGEQNKEKNNMTNNPCSEIDTKVSGLEATVKTLQAEVTAKNTIIDDLSKKLNALEAERHSARVNDVLDLRFKAGLVEDREKTAEIERLSKFSAEVLESMKADLARIVKKTEFSSQGPKAKYTAEQEKSAEEQVRMDLFGTTRHLWDKKE